MGAGGGRDDGIHGIWGISKDRRHRGGYGKLSEKENIVKPIPRNPAHADGGDEGGGARRYRYR